MKLLLGTLALIIIFLAIYKFTGGKESSFKPFADAQTDAKMQDAMLEKHILEKQENRLYAKYLKHERDTVILGDTAVMILRVSRDTVISLKGKTLPYKIGS